ncbi:MAG: hypothetical protein ACXVR1_00525 [Solirubrobacteraceae bacterium]
MATLAVPAACAVLMGGCSAATRPAGRLPASALPYLGVACGVPDWTGCDRVRIGVRLGRRATRVTVSIGGRLARLSPPPVPGDDLWEGALLHAGLRRGPLAVHPTDSGGYWYGTPEVYPRVRVTAYFPDRTRWTRAGTVLLHPGYG